VLVNEAKYNVKSGKWSQNPQVITQLMGKQEAIDAVKEEAAKINKGPWKNVYQFRPM